MTSAYTVAAIAACCMYCNTLWKTLHAVRTVIHCGRHLEVRDQYTETADRRVISDDGYTHENLSLQHVLFPR